MMNETFFVQSGSLSMLSMLHISRMVHGFQTMFACVVYSVYNIPNNNVTNVLPGYELDILL